MNGATASGPNPYLENSILGSKYLDPGYLFDQGVNFLEKIASSNTLDILNNIAAFASIIFLAIIIYTIIRLLEIRAKEHAHMHHEMEEYRHKMKELEEKTKSGANFKDKRWQKVLDYLFSDNENDWRLAILEADNMLDDLMTQLGFQGQNLGDKLKDANQDSFRMLSTAWEVHNIRNKVAHEGSDFSLSRQEAKRIIASYEDIFKNFGFI